MSAWGGYFPGMDLSDYTAHPTEDQIRLRYCAACACAQRGIAKDPCWSCGGETTPDRPAYWPSTASGVVVHGGLSFSPTEVLDAEGAFIPERHEGAA